MTEAIGYEIQRALQRLQLAIRGVESACKPEPSPPRLPRLEAAVAELGKPQVPHSPDNMEKYFGQWKDYLDGRLDSLSLRAIRNLCWEPRIATDLKFQCYLDRNHIVLKSKALVGLIRSCHAVWNDHLVESGLLKKVRLRLSQYSGPNRLLGIWKEAEEMIIGDHAPQKAVSELLTATHEVALFCKKWGIAEDSRYVQLAVAHATRVCRDKMDRDPNLREYLLAKLLAWQQWEPKRFREEVSKTILAGAADRQEVRDALREFVAQDHRLGDPRLEHNRMNWAGIREAEAKVIEWFSQFDIVFFFEHVLPGGNDPHGRKEFWLRYVRRVRRSRPLLSWEDRTRLDPIVGRQALQSIAFGSMADWESTSSFLLDFGKIIVIEFSAVGNACYIYTDQDFNEIMPDFWSQQKFEVRKLKISTSITKQPVSFWDGVHRAGWQGKAGHLLASYGIRP